MIEYRLRSGIAQLAERFSVKEDVVGPSPTPGASVDFLVANHHLGLINQYF